MAVLVIILLLFLPSAALAAFPPAFSVFLACGAASNVSFPLDAPARTFTPDASFLTSSGVPAVTNANAAASPPLYAAARASTSAFTYRLPASPSSAGQFLVLRLHFFPFAGATTTSTSYARFTVTALDAFTLLPAFSPPTAGIVKEFLLPASGGEFRVTFAPAAGAAAFVNAVELFPAPPELLWNLSVTPVGAVSSADVTDLWPTQALETAYRLNVGGPAVTTANGTLWRTWLPDGAFLFGPPGLSQVNSTRSRIVYSGYDSDVAPEAVYRTQRTPNASAQTGDLVPGPFNVTWTFPADPRADYLVRLHFCDYEMLSSIPRDGAVFDVFVAGAMGTLDLSPKKIVNQNNQAFYLDYAAAAPAAGNLTVSIGMSDKSSEGGFLNGLEIMKLLPPAADLGSSSSGGGKRRTMIIIALSAVLGVSVLASMALCIFLVLRRRRVPRPGPEEVKESSSQPPWSPYTQDGSGSGWALENSSGRSGEGTRMQRMASNQLHVALEELKEATDNFHERNLVGVGGFGNVYRGVLRDGTRVAVKRATRASKQGLPEFHTEILVLSAIRHRHLVSLVGYCNEQSEMILVYEYMEKGTLRGHLYGSDAPPLPWKTRLEICIGAARGLHYLHTGYSENIIHRDVKSTNILLGDGYTAKVADFGLSRVGPAAALGQTHVSTAVKGSFGYLDPEYFKTQQLTDRSDVYSFGVVLFEVLCARPVIDQSLERDQINLAEWAMRWHRAGGGGVGRIADPRIAGQVNENSLRKFAETAAKCLADYGVDRPSMGDVLWNLEYCLQLQETHVWRDAFEDSGAAATQFPEDVVVPRWVPEPTASFLTVDDADVSDVGVANSKVFSQLNNGEGR